MNNKKIYLFSLQTAIITCGISVSLSQLFLGITLILFLSDRERRKRITPTPFLITILIFFSIYFISFLYHIPISDTGILPFIKQSEFKDILLFFAFFLTLTLERSEFKKIESSFVVLLSILTITGFFSIFSIYRFTYLFNSLFRTVTTWKYQHHYGAIGGVDIYLPIGLMNTHLTFGGIVAFLIPFAFFRGMDILNNNSERWKKILILGSGLSLLLVVLLNNARSAIFGSVISMGIGLFINIFVKKTYNMKSLYKFTIIPLVFLISVLSALSFTEPFRRTVLPLLGGQKHTDSGRTFIWDSTFSMIEKHPILGVGPGNYPLEIDRIRKERSEKNPDLLFFYEVTQRGHAHNDYFHIMAISGVLNGFVYAAFLFLILRKVLQKAGRGEDVSLYLGLVGFFFAGAFQCYFQDDEVVIVFWYLAGLLFHERGREDLLL